MWPLCGAHRLCGGCVQAHKVSCYCTIGIVELHCTDADAPQCSPFTLQCSCAPKFEVWICQSSCRQHYRLSICILVEFVKYRIRSKSKQSDDETSRLRDMDTSKLVSLTLVSNFWSDLNAAPKGRFSHKKRENVGIFPKSGPPSSPSLGTPCLWENKLITN